MILTYLKKRGKSPPRLQYHSLRRRSPSKLSLLRSVRVFPPTPSAGSSPQRPRPRSTNRCHARLRAGTSSFSSKRMVQQNVMLTIADCHADENQHRMFFEKYVCFEWHFARSYRPLVRWLVKNLRFLTRSPQHGTLAQCRFWLTTITSFECSLCETPPLRKETREGLC